MNYTNDPSRIVEEALDILPKEDSTVRQTLGHLSTVVVLGIIVMFLAACGSTPVSDSKYTRVETMITEAKEVSADDLAGDEIYQAEKKLKAARNAETQGKKDKALRLLKESELHAELAEIRAMAKTQQKSLDEIRAGLATLEHELNQ